MAKKLIVNCGDCDARGVSEETLAAYESIIINAGDILVTPEAKELLNRYGVTMNCGDILEVEKDVKVCTVNGPGQIKSSDVVSGKTFITINGPLEIGPDTQAVLEGYVGINVNGPLTCPESMSGYIGKIKVNGPIICYPDGAIVLKRNAVIDKLFPLRAKNRLYWSAKRMVMVDPQLDAEKLAAKGATFSSGEVILAESKVESLIELIDEKAEIIIVPDGTAVILDDMELNGAALKRYGTKMYIAGDLRLTKESGTALEKLEYLNVQGDAEVPAELRELLMEKAAQITGDIQVKAIRGRYMSDKMSVRISRKLLEQEEDGICLEDCIKVVLDRDIPDELITERLEIRDCLKVLCTPEQEAAVALVSEDVMSIGSDKEEDGTMGIGGILKAALGGADPDTKVINAGDYVL